MTILQLEPALLFDSNIFLILGDEKTALIDTGTGFQLDSTIKSIDKGLNGRSLDYVILTHRHYDHVGGLSGILSKYCSEAMAGELDAIPLREGDSQSTMGVSFGGSIPKMDVKSVKDGDVIDLGGHVLRIIETPGHTAGSICIFDESTSTLFSGDLFFFDGVGRTDLPTGSSDDLIKSLIKLKSLNFTGLSSGHGPVVSNNGPVYLQNSLRMMGVNQ